MAEIQSGRDDIKLTGRLDFYCYRLHGAVPEYSKRSATEVMDLLQDPAEL